MTVSPIKTALIGYGFSAKTFHIPFITTLPEFELVAISSSQKEAVLHNWPQPSTVTHYSSAEELLLRSDAELVIITAPNEVHFALAHQALENDKHVILEKPFVTTVADGETLIALAAKKQRLLSVFHNRRYDGDFLTVQKLIKEQRLGDVKHFESHYDRFRPQVRQRWREQASNGGGILFDLGPHLLDQALQLFGIPDAITAQCHIMRDGATTVDYFHLVLHYPKMLATLHADVLSAGPNKRFSVHGSKGSYHKQGSDPQEAHLIAGVLPTQDNWADESPEEYGRLYHADGDSPITTERGVYQQYFRAIASAIRQNTPCPVTAEQALWSIKLIELAIQSSRLGQTLEVQQVP